MPHASSSPRGMGCRPSDPSRRASPWTPGAGYASVDRVAGLSAAQDGSLMTDHTASDRPDDAAPDADGNGAGSESPEEGAAAQKDADESADTDASPSGPIS